MIILGLIALVGIAFIQDLPADRKTLTSNQIYVIDGDTIAIGEDRVRLVGFDTPETKYAECAEEKELGLKATKRLRELVSEASKIELALQANRDKYGRYLGQLILDGHYVGDILIDEGLARLYSFGKRKGWC